MKLKGKYILNVRDGDRDQREASNKNYCPCFEVQSTRKTKKITFRENEDEILSSLYVLGSPLLNPGSQPLKSHNSSLSANLQSDKEKRFAFFVL